MGFISPGSKLERAVRALLILQGKSTADATFISNDLRDRVFPNRTVLASSFTPTVPHRQGGVVTFSVEHHFNTEEQAGDLDGSARREALDAFVGATADTLTVSDGNSLNSVADAITTAGRWLAQTDGTPEGDAIAANEADMASFRCDWIKMSEPFLVRGRTKDEEGTWLEILNFTAFVSHATD